MSTQPCGSAVQLPSLSRNTNNITANLLSLKAQSRAREEEERTKQKRRRGALVLMLEFLRECGYGKSLEALQSESGVSLTKYRIADNVDLLTVVQEYEDYCESRFSRRPKLFHCVEESAAGAAMDFAVDGEKQLVRKTTTRGAGTGGRPPPHAPPASAPSSNVTPPLPFNSKQRKEKGDVGTPHDDAELGAGISGQSIPLQHSDSDVTSQRKRAHASTPVGSGGDSDPDFPAFQGRAGLRPLPRFETSELNDLAQTIFRDILDQNPSVAWNDIAELKGAKQLLQEAIVLPIKYPQLFQGIVRPWRGILLFGPPGTGKTMLAKAVATECRTTFFNISASTIVSKWRGDSEKLVRMLFELAVHFAPSTIFLDELDSVMSQRTSDGSEHEGSRRMKTELLQQMDGLCKRKNGDIVFVLAASNTPWDLDGAVLRRLEKRIHVGLPDKNARKDMFRSFLKGHIDPACDFDEIARKTEGYSGADIDIICREATMRTVRNVIHQLEAHSDSDLAKASVPTSVAVSTQDVEESIRCTKSSCLGVDMAKYTTWEHKHGSSIST